MELSVLPIGDRIGGAFAYLMKKRELATHPSIFALAHGMLRIAELRSNSKHLRRNSPSTALRAMERAAGKRDATTTRHTGKKFA